MIVEVQVLRSFTLWSLRESGCKHCKLRDLVLHCCYLLPLAVLRRSQCDFMQQLGLLQRNIKH